MLVGIDLPKESAAMPELTKHMLDAIQPESRVVFIWDDRISGFGLKVTPKGRKVFVLQFRLGGRNVVTQRYTIGRYGNITVAQARKLARELRFDLARRLDPRLRKSGQRERSKPAPTTPSFLPDRRRSSPGDTIVRGAIQIFLRDGYGASLNSIAGAAGVSRRTLYNHFAGKEQLFKVVVDHYIRQSQLRLSNIQDHRDVRQTLQLYLRRYLDEVLNPDNIAFYRLLITASREHSDLVTTSAAPAVNAASTWLSQYLAREMAAGRLRHEEPDLAAERLMSSVAGPFRFSALVGLPISDLSYQNRIIEDTLNSFLRVSDAQSQEVKRCS
jgi:AcrR family transcriptional regulator